jgi:hypothetical protein
MIQVRFKGLERGDQVVSLIRAVRKHTPMGLKDSKASVESFIADGERIFECRTIRSARLLVQSAQEFGVTDAVILSR